ncbi:hypothetical protein HY405_01930 [Candidatus Microgenomates bacterium]|nr:hypothetical protein [Candidatus Microgenomates bacterium]
MPPAELRLSNNADLPKFGLRNEVESGKEYTLHCGSGVYLRIICLSNDLVTRVERMTLIGSQEKPGLLGWIRSPQPVYRVEETRSLLNRETYNADFWFNGQELTTLTVTHRQDRPTPQRPLTP